MLNFSNINRNLYPRLPLALICIVPAIWLLTIHPAVSSADLITLAVSFFLFDNLGVQLGVHKLLCHRSFESRKSVVRVLAFLSVLSGQGSPLVWVAVHMGSHHPNYDTPKDIHTPARGLWFAFIAWYWRCDKSLINMTVAREYLRDNVLVFLHKYHAFVLLWWWAVLYIVGGMNSLLFMGIFPAALSIVLAGFVNAFMHTRGTVSRILFLKYQNHPGDTSYNSVWLGVLTMGLGLHNNHHHQPSQAIYRKRWFEFDPSALIIPLIRKR